jgi:hypothetical protein
MLILGTGHLERVLRQYASHYSEPHKELKLGTPISTRHKRPKGTARSAFELLAESFLSSCFEHRSVEPSSFGPGSWLGRPEKPAGNILRHYAQSIRSSRGCRG